MTFGKVGSMLIDIVHGKKKSRVMYMICHAFAAWQVLIYAKSRTWLERAQNKPALAYITHKNFNKGFWT